MAFDLKNIEQWTINDYVQYFSGSSRLVGNSERFEEIKSLAQELQQMESQMISVNLFQDRTKKLESVIEGTMDYINSHANPWTSTGKERKRVIDSFQKYCQNEKRYADSEVNVKYFYNQSLDSMRQGVEIRQIHNLQSFMDRLKKGPMTEDTVSEYASYMNQYIKASEVFLFHHPEYANLGMGDHGETMQSRIDSYKKQMDSVRDLRTVRNMSAEGKNWDDLLAQKETVVEITGRQEIVGDNVSQRLKMTYNGKKGFFTEKDIVLEIDGLFERALESSSEPERRAILESNKDLIIDNWSIIGGSRNEQTFSFTKYVHVGVCRLWDHLDSSPRKDEIKELLLKDPDGKLLTDVFRDYRKKVSAKQGTTLSEEKKRALFRETLEEQRVPNDISSLMLGSSKELCAFADEVDFGIEDRGKLRAYTRLDLICYSDMLNADLSTENGRKQFEARSALVHNHALRSEVVGMAAKAAGFNKAQGDAGSLDYGSELTGRNVASSRIAELLGVGSLLAHSEKMTVKMPDGRIAEGCFMEFAEGLDLRNGGDQAVMESSRLSMTRNAGFMKDACNLEVLDYICAQGDRHGGNMFVKLGEIREDGTRQIVGIQGIDNDLAFTSRSKFNVQQDSLDNLHFIDEAMAKRIMELDRDKLEVAVGDILSTKEMDALCDRIEMVKKNIDERMIKLKGDQWNLEQDPKEFGEKAELYEKAIRDNEKSLSAKYPWQKTHKNAFIKMELDKMQAEYGKETEILGDISSMFEQAEMTEEKVVKSPVKMTLKELEGNQRASDRGIKFGAARERAARMKKLEESFTEISKADMEQAKERVKKPLIGGHRGPKK